MLSLLAGGAAWFRSRLNISNERGATMVEYGLLVAFIALVVGLGAVLLGDSIRDLFVASDGAIDKVPIPDYAA